MDGSSDERGGPRTPPAPRHALRFLGDALKCALVTGGAGFIGRRLIQELVVRRVRVDTLVRQHPQGWTWGQEVTVIEGDICVKGDLDRLAGDYDVVFHLAGRAHAVSDGVGNENLYQTNNVDGTRHVLDVAEARRARGVVFFSSVKAMGEESTACLDESAEASPETPYGQSKLAAERLVFESGKRTGMHVVCLRLPMVYGPGNKGNMFRMISAIDHGRFPPVAGVRNARSMVHVANVVDAALLAATRLAANSQSYIVTDVRPYSTGEIYEGICRALGKSVPRWSVPLPVLRAVAYTGDIIGRIQGKRWLFDSDALEKLTGDAWYSSEKISRELGYSPRTTFEDALPEMIAWYRETQARPTC